MTSIILTTICALALYSAPVPSQPQYAAPTTIVADTLNLYVIDSVPVSNFDGTQLLGKTITSYEINKTRMGESPVIIHNIGTKDGAGEQTVVVGYGVQKMDEVSGSDDVTVVSLGENIRIRPTSPTVSADDIFYIVDGKQTSSEDFRNLNPKNIKAIAVMKGSSAAKYLQELKDQGKYQGETDAPEGLIIVTLKK